MPLCDKQPTNESFRRGPNLPTLRHSSAGRRSLFSDGVMSATAILSGFGVGAIVGMTGVGGGSLMTPLLLSAFRLSPAVAIGTDLWFAALTKTAGSLSHHQAGHVQWRIVALLLGGRLSSDGRR